MMHFFYFFSTLFSCKILLSIYWMHALVFFSKATVGKDMEFLCMFYAYFIKANFSMNLLCSAFLSSSFSCSAKQVAEAFLFPFAQFSSSSNYTTLFRAILCALFFGAMRYFTTCVVFYIVYHSLLQSTARSNITALRNSLLRVYGSTMLLSTRLHKSINIFQFSAAWQTFLRWTRYISANFAKAVEADGHKDYLFV